MLVFYWADTHASPVEIGEMDDGSCANASGSRKKGKFMHGGTTEMVNEKRT